MFKKLFDEIWIVFLLIVPSALAQSNADELLQKIRIKLDSVTDLSADFKQSVNEKLNLIGTVHFKKPNKLRLELDNALIISDGETSWNFNKKKNEVLILENDENTSYLSIRKVVYDYPDKCKLSFEESEGRDVLVLVPENSELTFTTAKLFVNGEDLIFKLTIDDPALGLIQLDFSNHKVNRNLPDSEFSFTPPEGSKVIDLR